jgi:hypothetical protein
MRNPDLFRQVSLQSEFEQLFPDNKVSRNLKTKGPVALTCVIVKIMPQPPEPYRDVPVVTLL